MNKDFNFDMDITAKRIAERRIALKMLKQSDLAEKAGIASESVSRYERKNPRIPKIDTLCLLSAALECDPNYLLGIYDHPTKEVTDVASALPISRSAIEGLMKLKQDRDSDKLKELNYQNPYSTFAGAIDYMICGMLDSAGYHDDSGHYEGFDNNQSYSLIFDLIKSAKALKAMDEIPADQADANPFFADNYNNMEMSYKGILFNLGQELSNIIAAYVNEHIYNPEEV